MAIELNGTTGITTPDVTTDSGASLTTRVAKTGDTMTGNLIVSPGDGVAGIYGYGLEVTRSDAYVKSSGTLRLGTAVSYNSLLIDTSGRVTMPYQPAFSARASGSGTNPGSNQTLPFTTVNVNTGGHYNTATSTFTAPIAGMYFFYFQALGDAGVNNRAMAYIQLNSGPHIEASATTKDYNSVQAQVIISLAAGDAVRVQTAGGAEGARFYTLATIQNWFMGYLLG